MLVCVLWGRYNVEKGQDVLGQYVESMEKAGVGHGFYYSLDSNFYLQQGQAAGSGPNISAAEFQVSSQVSNLPLLVVPGEFLTACL
jgi:hypothetical protein